MKKLKDIPQIVYHGTTSKDNEYLSLKNIRLISLARGNPRADFGQGFYVTSKYKQVLSFARCRTNIINREMSGIGERPERPIILKYGVNTLLLSESKGVTFEIPDNEWARFVFNNRAGKKYLISDSHNTDRRYDYVYGHVADGKVARIVKEYKYEDMNINSFRDKIKPKFPQDNDQLSFHSEEALRCLEFFEETEDADYRFKG